MHHIICNTFFLSGQFQIKYISAIQLWINLSADKIVKISNELNGHQMFEFNFNIFQRTSSFGYLMNEFLFISIQVAFGQYFMQRCVAMKTLSQVWASPLLNS